MFNGIKNITRKEEIKIIYRNNPINNIFCFCYDFRLKTAESSFSDNTANIS